MSKKPNIMPHPTSVTASTDRAQDRENLARQLRTTQMMREQAREQIVPTDIITSLIAIDCALMGETDLAGNSIPLEREVISALKARADIKFKLLGKVLPDLKATESVSHNTHDHLHAHGDLQAVSNMELAQRLQLWRRSHLKEINEAEIVIPEPLNGVKQSDKLNKIEPLEPLKPRPHATTEVAPEQPPTFDFLL